MRLAKKATSLILALSVGGGVITLAAAGAFADGSGTAASTIDPAKQALLDKANGVGTTRSAAVKPPVTTLPSAAPEPVWDLGIITDAEAPFPTSELNAINRFVGLEGNHYNVVYAGADGSNASLGVAFAQTYSTTDGSLLTSKAIPVDPAQGPVQVVSSVGTIVYLQAANGSQHTYNFTTGAFA